MNGNRERHAPTDHAWQAIVLARWARRRHMSIAELVRSPVFHSLAVLYRRHHPEQSRRQPPKRRILS
jgi:hypothetical protein